MNKPHPALVFLFIIAVSLINGYVFATLNLDFFSFIVGITLGMVSGAILGIIG